MSLLQQYPLNNKQQPQLLFNKKTVKKNKINCSESITSCSLDISTLSPGAFSFIPYTYSNQKPIDDNFTLDINELKKQYSKLKQRQQQAQIIIQTANDIYKNKNIKEEEEKKKIIDNKSYILHSPLLLDSNRIYNHLLIKPENKNKNTFKQKISLTCKKHTDDEEDDDDDDQVFSDETKPTISEIINREDKKEIIKSVHHQQQPIKINNPFQIKPFNSMVAKNGIRLGLYK